METAVLIRTGDLGDAVLHILCRLDARDEVIPQGDLGGESKKTVVLVLDPGTGYTVGTTGRIKVKILAPAE